MADRRPSKRPKISRGEDDYMPGNIVEIELHNFMTFDILTCKPGPRLNLVVGPNGSGKSSIVCAIALGLGGEPQLLGRASSIAAFVKRGEESGYIKISLRGDTKEEHLNIMRKIDTRNKSEWLFNGKVVPKKDVVEVIQRFNIQVNNLTQFLPQDRVCEFAKLTPVQLLEETEKAVGDPQLPVQHRALVDKSGELKKLERNIQRNGEYLNQLRLLNSEQERDVERVRQREELLEKAESMKKKLPWLKYDAKRAELREAKEQEKDAKKKLDEAGKSLDDAREPIKKERAVKAAEDAKCKKISSLLDGNAKKRMQLVENENSLGAQVRSKYSEMEELKRQEESRQQRILRAKEELISAEVELANLPPYETPKNELEKLGAQIMELEEIAREKRHQKAEKERLLSHNNGILRQSVDRLGDMENTNNKLLHALRKSGAEKILDAYRWVQEHRNEFNKEVYGPVLLEVKVSNRVHADYLEGHIAYYIWKSFITQDAGDRDTLVKYLGSLDVPVINHVGDGNREEQPFHVSEEMRALGIYSRLDQVFDAPVAVKEVLIGQFGLEYSYIGSKETDQRADEIQRLGIFDFWTPENHYRWSKSRYGGHISALVEPVAHSQLLLCNQDVGELERLRSRKMELEETIMHINESLKSLQIELRQAEDEAAKLQRQREEIISSVQLEKRKRREMENRINQRKIKLKSMEQEGDLDTVLANLLDNAVKLNIRRFECAIEIKNLIIEAVAYRRSFAERKIASIELEAKIREMEGSAKQQEKFVLQASAHLKYCEEEVESFNQQVAAAKRHAKSVAILTPELGQSFIEMPTTIEELEGLIEDTIAQANSIMFLNHNILEEYESRRKKVEELSRKQEIDEKEFSSQLDEINALKESWLPTLRSLVTQINETFSHNFQEMAVAGEVSLDEHDMDFDKYGVHIKVKFRQAGQLQVLSAHHQSGGERSVSTILYLVSLQDLTNCPFRVVDEINQGMDPINERKMFQQLVRAASQSNTPQCFLLTPKLLPNLEYSEACSILTVMNGPWIEESSKVWSSGECWGSVIGLMGTSL
ncbi:structural maintenance of chromosomes protein 5 [Rhododendron vialii]|uniref:structural maintenance of chromosomes protein 5 n=1 Tax=Rhododendron vialii TaxID=182163 RepID=UPI00265DDAF2|nr:structural maintenance of chromosomes protein 5 [Rhododendron vialii]